MLVNATAKILEFYPLEASERCWVWEEMGIWSERDCKGEKQYEVPNPICHNRLCGMSRIRYLRIAPYKLQLVGPGIKIIYGLPGTGTR